MISYDLLARQRQRELLREADAGRLRKAASEGRRVHQTRPNWRVDMLRFQHRA